MDLASICDVLKATQLADGELRKAAEQKLDEAASEAPDQLVAALLAVLLSADPSVTPDLRQESAVIVRQLVAGTGARDSVWDEIGQDARQALMEKTLAVMEHESNTLVRRSCCQVVSVMGNAMGEDFDAVAAGWPALFPTLSRLACAPSPEGVRVSALTVLKDLIPTVGAGLLAKGTSVSALLTSTLGDSAAQIRAAGAQLVLHMIETLDSADVEPAAMVMPALVACIQSLANEGTEDELKDTLQALTSAADEEPDFFRANGLKELWLTLEKICSSGRGTFADEDVRHGAMEAAMSLTMGLAEDIESDESKLMLQRIVGLNVAWMLEVEEDIEKWTKEGKETDDDDLDDPAVAIGEENMDRLAENIDEDVFMPILFKTIRAALSDPAATWKHCRSVIMCISQVVEHLSDEAWVDQCVEFVAQHFSHQHVRVRYASWWAIGQVCYDHSPHVQQTHCQMLVPAVIEAMQDLNIRVATSAVNAFTALAEELDPGVMEESAEQVLQVLFKLLGAGGSRILQEHCLSGIASVADVIDEGFAMYYTDVMPLLKSVVSNATGLEQRSLRGKAFECISLIGGVVGKEQFLPDAKAVMEVMVGLCQAGFAADDPQRESVHSSAEKIAETLGRDFKAYVPALLSSVFTVLKQRPLELAPEDVPDEDEEHDMSLTIEGDKILGLKTSVLSEMEDSIDLLNTFMKALEEDFIEFMPQVCQNLMPLLEINLSEDLREKAFKTWEVLVQCAKKGLDSGAIQRNVVEELVVEFLKKTVSAMVHQGSNKNFDNIDPATCSVVQAQAIGIAGVIREAGEGVLSKETLKDVLVVLAQFLSKIKSVNSAGDDVSIRRRKGQPIPEEDEDGDEKLDDSVSEPSPQSVRFALADAIATLMKVNGAEFAEVGLPPLMELAQTLLKEPGPDDRSLAFYIMDDVVQYYGESSVKYWDSFMNQALLSVNDKSGFVRQYATYVLSSGSQFKVFAPMAPTAAAAIYQVLQKHGERHRRRRAVKSDAKQVALAIDAAIFTLGNICENHEELLGAHADEGWSMWLTHLPLKYDCELGRKAHAQLLRLACKGHASFTSHERQKKVLMVLADVYKGKGSSKPLDKEIASAVFNIGEEKLSVVCDGFPEAKAKKIQQMLKSMKAKENASM